MLAETPVPPSGDFQGSRPPHALPRRRAAIASVVGHGVVLALLSFVSVRHAPPSTGESPLIMAELVTALDATAALTRAPTDAAERPLDRAVEEPRPAEPPAPLEPRPAMRPAEPATTAPAPEPEPEPQHEVEPAAAPAPPEHVVEVLEEPPAAPTVAEAATDEAPPAEVTPAGGPSRALASREQRAVQRKLSSWTGRFSAEEPDATLRWRDDGQEYTAVLKKLPAADAMGLERLVVELTTERDGERLVTELRMNRVAFSNFAQFIDRWDPDVQIHDDLIDGRFHSNTEVLVSRSGSVKPVFTGKVTLAVGDIRTEGPGFLNRRTMFPAGIETSVRRIVLPPRAATFEPGAVPVERLRRFERDSLITFNADGTFDASPLAGGEPVHGALGEEPFYLVGGADAALHVRGTVNGKVLVYSPHEIVVVDDVRYADDPRAQGATDYLGLVAERNVEIDEPEVTGAGDLEIHASIYARNRFLVRNFMSRRSGTLLIYGSVAAGSVSATEPRFATRIEFDDRLTTMRAPGFPMSDRYELDSASNEWRVVGTAD